MRADQLEAGATETWEAHGLRCMIRPSPMGTLNGYVQLPHGHVAFPKPYLDIEVEVHGGLTYGADGDGWVGFDTLHLGDVWDEADLPDDTDLARYRGLVAGENDPRFRTEWTLPRLRAEVESLAEQLAEMEKQQVTL